jgi:hypothetical protein
VSASPGARADLEAAIDRLYQLPVAEFTEARNALAAARKAEGDGAGASLVKALAKPTLVAWVVNLVYFKHRELFDGLASAMTELAAAQREARSGEGGPELREATRRKSEALQKLVRVAERRLLDAGSQAGLPVLQRVGATLEALAIPRPEGTAAPRAGRLVSELQPAGFDVALGLGSLDLPPMTPRAASEPAQPAPPPVVRSQAAPEPEAARLRRLAIQQAELEVAGRRRELEAAARALAEAESRTAAARADIAQLEARLMQTRSRAEERAVAESGARRALETAREDLAAAEAAIEALKQGA